MYGDHARSRVPVGMASPMGADCATSFGFQGAMKEALVFVAKGRAASTQPRAIVAMPEPRAPEPKPAEENPTPPADEPEPSVWVDRAKIAPNIYISRPDKKR